MIVTLACKGVKFQAKIPINTALARAMIRERIAEAEKLRRMPLYEIAMRIYHKVRDHLLTYWSLSLADLKLILYDFPRELSEEELKELMIILANRLSREYDVKIESGELVFYGRKMRFYT